MSLIPDFIQLRDPEGNTAMVAPELGGWLLRYTRDFLDQGPVDALYFAQAVIDRYPREMYAGNPLLFPIASFNHLPGADHHYEWRGRTFELPQHGFARRLPWQVVARTESTVTMELVESEATLAVYPFAFSHRLTYQLAGGRLTWLQEVQNRSREPMPFSTGFHPYFSVPLTPRGERAECFVEIPECRRFQMHGRGDRFVAAPFAPQNWSVDRDVSDTLFLGDLKVRELALVDPLSELEVVLNWEGAPLHRFAAIWARSTEAPFYCLEPWTALSNVFTRAKDRELILLEPGAWFRASFWMELRSI